MPTFSAVIQWISAAVEHARWQPPDQTMFLDTEHIERGKDPVEVAGDSELIYCDHAAVLSQLGVLDTPAAVGSIDSATKQGRLVARKSDGLPR